jgi:hypothetical protein
MKIRKFISCSLSFFVFVSSAQAQTVLFRQPGTSIESYQEAVRGSLSRVTPMDLLQMRLEREELPAALQSELDKTLLAVSKNPQKASELFESFYKKLEQEPRSAAIRETMKSVLERLSETANERNAEALRERRIELEGQTPSKWNSPTLAQKEVQEKLRLLRSQPGGEDLVLFINGRRWNESQDVPNNSSSQWIFISSQWRPRMISGNWSRVSQELQEGFRDWIGADCESSGPPALFAGTAQTEVFANENCQKSGADQVSGTLSASRPLFAEKSKALLWGAAALAVIVVGLSMSGKKIQIQRF